MAKKELLPPLPELAADAAYAVSDLFDDDEWDGFCEKSDLEKVRWRYMHADCDDFALALQVLSEGQWQIVGISCSKGPLHRLAKAPDGRLVDVHGYVTEDELRKRYGLRKLKLQEITQTQSMIDNDDDLRPVLAAMLYLPEAPFNERSFRRKIESWLQNGNYFAAAKPCSSISKITPRC